MSKLLAFFKPKKKSTSSKFIGIRIQKFEVNYTYDISHLTIPGFVLEEKLQRNAAKFAIFWE